VHQNQNGLAFGMMLYKMEVYVVTLYEMVGHFVRCFILLKTNRAIANLSIVNSELSTGSEGIYN